MQRVGCVDHFFHAITDYLLLLYKQKYMGLTEEIKKLIQHTGNDKTHISRLRDMLVKISEAITEVGGRPDTTAFNGFLDYNDTSTTLSPVILTADTWTDVPNDTLGAFTNITHLPVGMNTLIDSATGYLDFSELTLGSDMHIRISYSVTPETDKSLLESRYVLGSGENEYLLKINSRRLDNGSGVPYESDKGSFYIYMGDNNTLGGAGKLQVKLSTGGVLINSGIAIKLYKK